MSLRVPHNGVIADTFIHLALFTVCYRLTANDLEQSLNSYTKVKPGNNSS